MSVTASERQALARAAASVRWWPAALTLLVVGGAYAFMSDRLTLGPPWALLVLVLVVLAGVRVLRWRQQHLAYRWLALSMLAVVTGAISISALFLVGSLLSNRAQAAGLLLDAGLLWVSNILVFAVWYWEIDGGGPARRVMGPHCSTDFAFPQQQMGGDLAADWKPDLMDYLFLAFNTSTAFSPTDTLVLARRTKALMMVQSLISLVTIAVLAARAINTL